MATRAVNPYYNDPNIEAIASNIRKAFIDPNPGQTALYRQHGRLYGLQADEIERKQRSRSAIAGIFRQVQNGTLTPAQASEIAAAGIEGGVDPKDPSQYTLYTAANGGAPESAVGRAFVGAGHSIGKDQSFTTEGREAVAKRENDEAARRTGITAGATIESARIRDSGEDRRLKATQDWNERNPTESVAKGSIVRGFAAQDPNGGVALVMPPHNTARDAVTNYAPGDPRATGPQVEGPKSPDRVGVVPDPNSPTGAAFGTPEPGKPAFPPASAVPKPATPTDISPDEVAKLERQALADVGAADSQWNVDPTFTESYADKIPAARQAAAAAYQKSRNAADGQAAYLAALGIAPGSKWNSQGKIGRAFGAKPGFDPPKSAVGGAVTGGGTPTPPPATAPAPAPAAPGALPPPEKRVPGQTYPTPRGPMVWTGTGWIPPSNVK